MVKLTEALVLARSRASDLENVRKFNCWASDLTDISILRQMPNVQIISLSVNRVSSLSDLAHCKNLEELYIRKNEINSLSEILYLKQLPKLRVLWLADNPCAAIEKYRQTVLKHLPNLQKLDNVAVTENEVVESVEDGEELLPPVPMSDIPRSHIKHPQFEPCTAAVAASMPAFSAMALSDGPSRRGGASSSCENGASGGGDGSPDDNPATVSWEETNKIRIQLGLKPLPVEKVAQHKPRHSHYGAKNRNANLLQAVLHIIKELDGESLEIVADAVRNKMDSL